VSKKRPYTDMTVPHVPADERDIMAALLTKPLPPELGKPKRARKAVQKRAKRKGRA
jgi:hypothetical protein